MRGFGEALTLYTRLDATRWKRGVRAGRLGAMGACRAARWHHRSGLGTALLVEQHDEWLTMGKRYLPQSSMTRLLGGVPGTTLAELLKEGMAV